MKAIIGDTIIAESDKTIVIEGNHYFPPDSVKEEYFAPTDLHTTCAWKGQANYYTIKVGDVVIENAAWHYPHLSDMAIDRVKQDFTDYVAFYPQVKVG